MVKPYKVVVQVVKPYKVVVQVVKPYKVVVQVVKPYKVVVFMHSLRGARKSALERIVLALPLLPHVVICQPRTATPSFGRTSG